MLARYICARGPQKARKRIPQPRACQGLAHSELKAAHSGPRVPGITSFWTRLLVKEKLVNLCCTHEQIKLVKGKLVNLYCTHEQIKLVKGKTCQFILYTRANKTCQKGKPACQGKLGRACVGLKPFSSCLSTWRRWSAPSSWLQLRMISPPPILYPLFCTLKALFYKILRLHYYIGMIILGQCSHLC